MLSAPICCGWRSWTRVSLLQQCISRWQTESRFWFEYKPRSQSSNISPGYILLLFCFLHPSWGAAESLGCFLSPISALIALLLTAESPACDALAMNTHQECWLSRALLEMLWLDERCDVLSKWRQKNSALQPSLLHSCYLKRNPLCSA